MTFVASVSAGPPDGGLYLKPPSRGGLCDGVTTMPSARPRSLPRFARRIAWLTAGVADRVEVEDRREVVDVGREVVVAPGRVRGAGPVERGAVHGSQPVAQDLVRAVLHRLGDVAAGRTAVGRVVLDPAVLGRVVRGGDHDPVG